MFEVLQRLLSDDQLSLLEEYRNDNATCNGEGIPATENQNATFNALNTGLNNNTAHGIEMWLYNKVNSDQRQVRFVTPDHKYLYQAAIADNKLWAQMHTLVQVPGSFDIVNSKVAVADISSVPLQDWSHLMVQSATSLTTNYSPGTNTALTLNGDANYNFTNNLETVTNNFTVELWVNPTSQHEIDEEGMYSFDGITGQKYAIMPSYTGNGEYDKAGMGISVGTNGVSVYEHSEYNIPSRLVWEGPVSGWTHIAVVYKNTVPSLYINGSLVRTGILPSEKSMVFPGYSLLGGPYGSMDGQIDEVRIWNYARTGSQIQASKNTTVPVTESGLVGYWSINQEDGYKLKDKTTGGHHLSLPSSYSAYNWSTNAQSLGGVVPSPNDELHLYLDGHKLSNIAANMAPLYPFGWEVINDPSGADHGLKAYWPINQEDGQVLKDKIGVRDITLPESYTTSSWSDDAPVLTNNGTPVSNTALIVDANKENGSLADVSNTFTVELWVKPDSDHQIDTESNTSKDGDLGQNYAIFPNWEGDALSGKASMGISVGTNGVSVYEHAGDYMPPLLVWEGAINGWTHLAVVYENKTPRLYINGVLVRTGLTSTKDNIYPSYSFPGGTYGSLSGKMDEVRIYNYARSIGQIQASMNTTISSSSDKIPAVDIALLKHLRVYDRIATDEEVAANYRNSCLAPVGNLAAQNTPLMHWGRFNIPAPGSETTIGPGSTVEKVSRFITPQHELPTNYVYNSLNQIIKQSSPDGGTSEFWYDRLGRLSISQNEEQKQPRQVDADNPEGRYSYTRYDALGRITEIGEKMGANTVTEDITRNEADLQTWLNSATNRQVTLTAYDQQPSWAPASLVGMQSNLRKRVSASALLSTATYPTNAAHNRLSASYYSYDIMGNVQLQVQENTALSAKEPQYINGSTGLKHIRYDYDLVSGKVNKVLYQEGKWDQFFYHYQYDADNRLISAWSSRVNTHNPVDASDPDWRLEARYRYYLHGPLARVELGRNQVQGLDYAYTLQGWLKGVNSQVLQPGKDMSGDGNEGSVFQTAARDVLGYSLGYYKGDYDPIGGSNAPAFGLSFTPPTLDPTGLNRSFESGKSLFNGNIGHATYAISKLDGDNITGYTYRYDQLNRLTAMNRHGLTAGTASWSHTTGTGSIYNETYSYDGNGNIKTLQRNGDKTATPLMDDLTYHYLAGTNKLTHVNDAVTDLSRYDHDIEDQGSANYSYDKIGNLVGDVQEGIDKIGWTVYGKISSIYIGDGTFINYGYDVSGNRISKAVSVNGSTTTTYYVRDAQGNVLGVYEDRSGSQGSYSWLEQHLYGSSRLGMVTPNYTIPLSQPLGSDGYTATNDPLNNGIEGLRSYELSNHLGNVLATISDRKIGRDLNDDGIIDYFEADVVSAHDYYPFGMQMPGRTFNGSGYRYGFNGKENDNEVKGEGNQQDYGMQGNDKSGHPSAE